jgi:hypothetical protein
MVTAIKAEAGRKSVSLEPVATMLSVLANEKIGHNSITRKDTYRLRTKAYSVPAVSCNGTYKLPASSMVAVGDIIKSGAFHYEITAIHRQGIFTLLSGLRPYTPATH